MEKNNDFIIYLTIEGTEYKDIEVKVGNPNLTIKQQINSIVNVFELPLDINNGGHPYQYLLGHIIDDGEEIEILEFEDEDGREQSFYDYNIRPGDKLHLFAELVCGGIWCNIIVIKTINILFFRYQYFKIFKVDDNNWDICRLWGSPENHIQDLITYLKLNNKRQYYLAKINSEDDEIKLFFLNGKTNNGKQQTSVFTYYDILKSQDGKYPYLLLYPITGMSKRTFKKLNKIAKNNILI